MTSILGTNKSRRPGRPPAHTTSVNVRLPPDLLAALDLHIAEAGRSASRPDWIRLALREWLSSHGRLDKIASGRVR
ncbi:ribbon-helix-helix domain-containing protein [Methylobacterium sp. E-065]|uniref:ribbon-helix-helix domain-containing protein n=1 Tax=Methylobacterium sp. E-065 TaxID=2836583 RepID=UPI003918FC63